MPSPRSLDLEQGNEVDDTGKLRDEGGRWEATGARDDAGIDGSGPARANPGDAAVDGAPATDE